MQERSRRLNLGQFISSARQEPESHATKATEENGGDAPCAGRVLDSGRLNEAYSASGVANVATISADSFFQTHSAEVLADVAADDGAGLTDSATDISI